MGKLIDADKLLKTLDDISKRAKSIEMQELAKALATELINGTFDPDPPTIKPGDKVRIISALAREWIGREAVVTEVYTEPFLHFSLDIGGGHWTPSCLEVIESD